MWFDRFLREHLGRTYTWFACTFGGLDNVIEGCGAYYASDGRVFKGQWQDSEIHGMVSEDAVAPPRSGEW